MKRKFSDTQLDETHEDETHEDTLLEIEEIMVDLEVEDQKSSKIKLGGYLNPEFQDSLDIIDSEKIGGILSRISQAVEENNSSQTPPSTVRSDRQILRPSTKNDNEILTTNASEALTLQQLLRRRLDQNQGNSGQDSGNNR